MKSYTRCNFSQNIELNLLILIQPLLLFKIFFFMEMVDKLFSFLVYWYKSW